MAVLEIPVAKAGGKTISVNTDDFGDEIFTQIIEEGLKVILNSRMTKIGAITKLEGAEKESAMAAALEKANENLADLQAGKIKRRGSAKAKSAEGKDVMTEARRLAKEIIKDEIRDAGMRISMVPASDITKAANALLASDQGAEIISKAKANIEARKAIAAPAGASDDERKASALAKLAALGGIAESPKLKAKAEKDKADRKSTLSKTQASKPAKRKGDQPAA